MSIRRLLRLVAPLALIVSPAMMEAQRPTSVLRSPPNGYRYPALATALSVILPGGGQFYTGRSVKGALILAGTVVSATISIDGANHPCGTNPSGVCGNGVNENLGIVGMLAFWAYGWATAAGDARQHNADLVNGTTGFAPFLDRRSGRTMAGLSLSGIFAGVR